MSRGSLVVLALLSCGPKVQKQDSYPTLEPVQGQTLPDPTGGTGLGGLTSARQADRTWAPAAGGAPASGPLKDTLPKELVGYPLHVKPTTLLLFPDEQVEAAQMIATALRAAGLTVVDPKQTFQVYDRAARGLHPVTGKPCGSELADYETARRWPEEVGAKGRVEAAVYCESKCWIEVNISEGIEHIGRDKGRTAYYAAPYDIAQPWRSELPKRLAELVAFKSDRDWGPAKLVPGAVDEAAKPDLAYADTNANFDLPPPLVAAAHKCLERRGAVEMLLETDASDKITKCDAYERLSGGNRADLPCVCKALAGKPFGGTGPRRMNVVQNGVLDTGKTTTGFEMRASVSPGQRHDEDKGLFEMDVSHPSIAWWDYPSSGQLEPCFQTHPVEASWTADIEITFDALGTATKATLTPTLGKMTAAQTKCVHDLLLTSKASCPAVPTSTARATLGASVYKP